MHAAHSKRCLPSKRVCTATHAGMRRARVRAMRGYAPCAITRRAQLRSVHGYAKCKISAVRGRWYAPCVVRAYAPCASGDTPCTACPSRRGEGQGYRVRSARPSPALSLQVLRVWAVLQDLHERCPPGWNIFRVGPRAGLQGAPVFGGSYERGEANQILLW